MSIDQLVHWEDNLIESLEVAKGLVISIYNKKANPPAYSTMPPRSITLTFGVVDAETAEVSKRSVLIRLKGKTNIYKIPPDDGSRPLKSAPYDFKVLGGLVTDGISSLLRMVSSSQRLQSKLDLTELMQSHFGEEDLTFVDRISGHSVYERRGTYSLPTIGQARRHCSSLPNKWDMAYVHGHLVRFYEVHSHFEAYPGHYISRAPIEDEVFSSRLGDLVLKDMSEKNYPQFDPEGKNSEILSIFAPTVVTRNTGLFSLRTAFNDWVVANVAEPFYSELIGRETPSFQNKPAEESWFNRFIRIITNR